MIELQTLNCGKDEQETSISYSRNDELMTLYTSDNTVVTKMQKLLNAEGSEWTLTKVYKNRKGEPTGYEFTAPKKMLNLRPKKKVGRELTEAEKQVLRERLRDLRGASQASDDEFDGDDE